VADRPSNCNLRFAAHTTTGEHLLHPAGLNRMRRHRAPQCVTINVRGLPKASCLSTIDYDGWLEDQQPPGRSPSTVANLEGRLTGIQWFDALQIEMPTINDALPIRLISPTNHALFRQGPKSLLLLQSEIQ